MEASTSDAAADKKSDKGNAAAAKPDATPVAYIAPDPTAQPRKSNAPSTPPAPLPTAEAVSAPQATAPATYCLPDVLQAVLQNHPALCLRQQEVEAARARLITAGLLPNPQLVVDTVTETLDHHTEMNARLMFTVPLGPKRRWQTAAACSAIAAEQFAMSQEARALLVEAADAALEVHFLQEQAALQVQVAELESRLVAIQKDLFDAAAAPYRSVVLASLASGDAELKRREAVARLAQAQVRLARAMGLKEHSAVIMQGQLSVERVPNVSFETVLNRALEVAPELAQSHALLRGSQQQLAFERWSALPDLSVGPRGRASFDGKGEGEIGARVAMDLPLFDRNQGGIAESAAVLNGNCARVDAAEITASQAVRAAYAALQNAQSRWDYYGASIRPQMEQVERIIQEGFADRAAPAYELTALLEALARMRLVELELRYDHQRARTRLELLLECRLQDLSADASPLSAAPAAPLPPAVTGALGS